MLIPCISSISLKFALFIKKNNKAITSNELCQLYTYHYPHLQFCSISIEPPCLRIQINLCIQLAAYIIFLLYNYTGFISGLEKGHTSVNLGTTYLPCICLMGHSTLKVIVVEVLLQSQCLTIKVQYCGNLLCLPASIIYLFIYNIT